MEFKKCSIGGTLYQEAGSTDELPLGCKVKLQPRTTPYQPPTSLNQPFISHLPPLTSLFTAGNHHSFQNSTMQKSCGLEKN